MKEFVLLVVVLAQISFQSDAAVVVTNSSRFSWDFALVGSSPGTASIDQFTIQYGPDLLNAEDMVLITVFAKNQSIPVYSHTSQGYGSGSSGLLWTGDWDTAFPAHEGIVVVEALSGELDLKRITILLRSSEFSGSASISPGVHLAPEPETWALVLTGSMLVFRRSRRVKRFNAARS